MPTVTQVIQRLLPYGTRETVPMMPHNVSWRDPPAWPTDLFAVTATLVDLAGCYAHRSLPGTARSWHERARELGEIWSASDPGNTTGIRQLSSRLQHLWEIILREGHLPAACRMEAALPNWCVAAMELMAIADEASAGIGFDNASGLAQTTQHWHWANAVDLGAAAPDEERRRRTATLCVLVPPEECCVQPKARTPQVGCNLRSLSLHLALLPPIGHVTTRHLISPEPIDKSELNLLLVPFPYEVRDDILAESERFPGEKWGRFELDQSWLPADWPEKLAEFVSELIVEAESTGDKVDGVVLAELSVETSGIDLFVEELIQRQPLDVLVAGALSREAGTTRNVVRCYFFSDQEVLSRWEQGKHHRWRLDQAQLTGYGLSLRGATAGVEWWWEGIDVANREVTFHMFHRDGGLLAAFVCEDLARIDPVQPVVRAVGPNLLLALLMDGPQSTRRWPGRYATGLCEDPGTSVLSVTCAAMPARWLAARSIAEDPAVALWKDAWTGVDPREIRLPGGHHAITLRLRLDEAEERTLDRRCDDGDALAVKFVSETPIRHPAPPAWLRA